MKESHKKEVAFASSNKGEGLHMWFTNQLEARRQESARQCELTKANRQTSVSCQIAAGVALHTQVNNANVMRDVVLKIQGLCEAQKSISNGKAIIDRVKEATDDRRNSDIVKEYLVNELSALEIELNSGQLESREMSKHVKAMEDQLMLQVEHHSILQMNHTELQK